MKTQNSEWWQDFFNGPAVRALRQFATPDQTRAEAAYLAMALRLSAGDRVLDVPCGDGRLALELAARGCRVTGVDLSPELLRHARAAAAERDLPVGWERRDMRDLPWRDRFDGAFCFGNSFGYLDEAGNAAFLRAVRQTLRSGGRFVLETGYLAESLFPAFTARRWFGFGSDLMLSDGSYDPALARLETDYIFVQDGEIARRLAVVRIYTLRELTEICRAAGFAEVSASSSLAGDAFRLGSTRLYLHAVAG